MKNLDFAKKWNSECDEEKWKILLKEHKNMNLYVFLDYDSVVVMKEEDEDIYLEFNEGSGCISGLSVLLEKLGVSVKFAE